MAAVDLNLPEQPPRLPAVYDSQEMGKELGEIYNALQQLKTKCDELEARLAAAGIP